MFLDIVLFILGFLLLIKGGDYFVDGSTKIAERFKIPEIIIGATIVSIGTTLPETLVSGLSAAQGHGEIAYGNAVGSIICNTALIAAITLTFKPSKINRQKIFLPVLFFLVSSAIYCAFAYLKGSFPRFIGIILVALFIAYIIIQIMILKNNPENSDLEIPNNQIEKELDETKEAPQNKSSKQLLKEILLIIVGATFIAVGAQLLINNGSAIARAVGIKESVIAITIVAIGTSLPELVTAITALVKGHSNLSIGNIIGANLFNILLVSGLSISISPFSIPLGREILNINSSLIMDIPVMLLVMGILVVPPLVTNKTYRWQGIILLIIYAVFMVLQFVI